MKEFNKNKYKIVKSVFTKETMELVKKYFDLKSEVLKTYSKHRYISPFNMDHGAFGDSQSNQNTFVIYGDVLGDSILLKLKPIFEKETGLELIENYTYLRIYEKGSVLEKHKDRFSCEISGTLNLDDNEWPIFLNSKGKDIEVNLKKGDLLIYKGCDLEHWRNKNPFDTHTQLFVHFNNVKTNSEKYDSRPHLGLPVSFKNKIFK
jgi:hypothetical protein